MDYFYAKLKANNLKLTPRRKAIIDIFMHENAHLTAEEVWEQLLRRFKHCGLPGVYRNLESLTDCGILTRVQQFDRKKHYGLCRSTDDRHHHHIICIKCGKVEELHECHLENRKVINGYRVVSHFIQVNGICASCS